MDMKITLLCDGGMKHWVQFYSGFLLHEIYSRISVKLKLLNIWRNVNETDTLAVYCGQASPQFR